MKTQVRTSRSVPCPDLYFHMRSSSYFTALNIVLAITYQYPVQALHDEEELLRRLI